MTGWDSKDTDGGGVNEVALWKGATGDEEPVVGVEEGWGEGVRSESPSMTIPASSNASSGRTSVGIAWCAGGGGVLDVGVGAMSGRGLPERVDMPSGSCTDERERVATLGERDKLRNASGVLADREDLLCRGPIGARGGRTRLLASDALDDSAMEGEGIGARKDAFLLVSARHKS